MLKTSFGGAYRVSGGEKKSRVSHKGNPRGQNGPPEIIAQKRSRRKEAFFKTKKKKKLGGGCVLSAPPQKSPLLDFPWEPLLGAHTLVQPRG